MALVNYMGDAPGFMSYSREPRLDVTNIPQRAKPVQSTAKQEDFDFDAKGNPGDKQFVYDQQKEFNSKVQSLYSKYGGEMAWVQSDPEYKKDIFLKRRRQRLLGHSLYHQAAQAPALQPGDPRQRH